MKGHLIVVLGDDENQIELSPYISDDEYLVTLFVKDRTSFEEIMNDDELFKDMIENYKYMFGLDKKYSVLTNFLVNNSSQIKAQIKACAEINFTGDFYQVKKYIEENNLTNKKIFYNDILPLKRESVKKVKEIFGDIPYMEFFIEGNDSSVTLEEYTKTVDKIEEIALEVRKLGFSPIEEIMYVYDLVRDREYMAEDDTEEYTTSRDLTSVLFGDKIVCVGFSVLFNAILNYLGHKTMNFLLTPLDGKEGHMRSLIYVKDEKYKIDGMYFFDPTYDCKKNNNNSFLEKYLFFAKSYKQMKRLDDASFDSDFFRFMDESAIDEIEDLFSEEKIHIFDLLRKINFTFLNKLLKFSGQSEVIIDNYSLSREDLIERICEISFLANRDITYDVFLEILYNVRRQQYYIDPQKYAFDMNTITNIVAKSRTARKGKNVQESLLLAVLGLDSVVKPNEAEAKVKDYFDKNDLEKDMSRVKLARILKSVSEQKEEEEKRLSFRK